MREHRLVRNCFLLLLALLPLASASLWANVKDRICGQRAAASVTKKLMDCDKLMNKNLAEIFDDCFYKVLGSSNFANTPKICVWLKSEATIQECIMKRYNELQLNMTQVSIESFPHEWCLMKVGSPEGWEYLCRAEPNRAEDVAIQKCERTNKDIVGPLNSCFDEIVRKAKDRRPTMCSYYENLFKMSHCTEKKFRKGVDNERKGLKYLNCLKNIRRNRPN